MADQVPLLGPTNAVIQQQCQSTVRNLKHTWRNWSQETPAQSHYMLNTPSQMQTGYIQL